MKGVFDDEEIEPAELRRDAELTLSTTMLIGLFVILLLICAGCFGLGYRLGRRGTPEAPASLPVAANQQTDAQPGGARPKPSATSQAAATHTESVVADVAPSADSPQSPALAASVVAPASQPQVRPALTSTSSKPPIQPSQKVEAALAPGRLMVQIAAVSHSEDAEVLVNALLKRGYAVSARRDAADGLIHVRVGPFNGRDEANRWRLKLLNDGYNAIVEP